MADKALSNAYDMHWTSLRSTAIGSFRHHMQALRF